MRSPDGREFDEEKVLFCIAEDLCGVVEEGTFDIELLKEEKFFVGFIKFKMLDNTDVLNMGSKYE